jgi:RNA polymerase sigma-70 factor, ECF subfamily
MADDHVDDELLALHRRLLEGDPTVSSELARKLLPRVEKRLVGSFVKSGGDLAEVASQVGLAIAQYLSEPERFDPSRAGLVVYLAMVARSDLLNELEARRREREREHRAVELTLSARNSVVEEEVLDAVDPVGVSPEKMVAALQELKALDEIDRKMVEMLVDGVRSTSAYAAVLGISHLPPDLQRKAVKRHKDRLQKRLERIGDRLA